MAREQAAAVETSSWRATVDEQQDRITLVFTREGFDTLQGEKYRELRDRFEASCTAAFQENPGLAAFRKVQQVAAEAQKRHRAQEREVTRLRVSLEELLDPPGGQAPDSAAVADLEARIAVAEGKLA